jgi:hypothetical protein
MRTVEQIADDARRLQHCLEIEAQIERVAEKHPGQSLRELAAQLPERESTRLLELADELAIWSQGRGHKKTLETISSQAFPKAERAQ